jgi:phosphate transport system substrate-binding protein
MNRILTILAAAALAAAPAAAAPVRVLNGAGSTFGYPIYSKWFSEYHKVHPGLQINYASIGSGGGIRQFTEKTVDFGATDGPMTEEQMQKAGGEILHLPTVLGGVVPIFNLKGVKDLRLDGATLAGIYMGKITMWNDPALVKLNPKAELPAEPIMVVHRADGSGTTYCFVDYLSKVSPEWEKSVGRGTSVAWPAGLGGKGSEGVTGVVKQNPGAIGYVELIYALQNGLSYASVRNRSGVFVKGTLAGVTAAAAGAARTMPKDFRVSITNAPGRTSYPISTFTWLLVRQQGEKGNGVEIRDFLRWMLKHGEHEAASLGYAPLPKAVQSRVAKVVETIKG